MHMLGCWLAHLVNLLVLLEGPDLLPDLLDLLCPGSLDDIVSTGVLVSCNEVWVVDTWQWHLLLHVRYQLPLKLPVKNLPQRWIQSALLKCSR